MYLQRVVERTTGPGEAYASAGQREWAVSSYEKSLGLNPKNDNGVEALRKLKSTAAPR